MLDVIEIRNVPEELYRRLEARAAEAGMSLSDFLLKEIHEMAEQPTLAEMRARLARLPPVDLSESPADAVRAERDGR